VKYALNLAEDNHILSACVVLPNGYHDGMPIVEVLPEGDVTDYFYIDDQYIYDPLPEPEHPEPEATTDDVLNALLGVTE
jgi:hypothetical protein